MKIDNVLVDARRVMLAGLDDGALSANGLPTMAQNTHPTVKPIAGTPGDPTGWSRTGPQERVRYNGYGRGIERDAERAVAREIGATKHHIGTVGEKIEVVAKILSTRRFNGSYGPTLCVKLEAEDGSPLVWFGSGAVAYRVHDMVGATIKATWTVKAHKKYEGTSETVLSRPTKLAEYAPPELGRECSILYLDLRAGGASVADALEMAELATA